MLGFVKDMSAGKMYLKDYNDFVDLYRAEGSGLRVVSVSHFPESPGLIGDLVGQESDAEVLPPSRAAGCEPCYEHQVEPEVREGERCTYHELWLRGSEAVYEETGQGRYQQEDARRGDGVRRLGCSEVQPV